MGQAYALKKGELKLADLNPEYRDQIKDLADSMTLKQLEDFAKTSHEGLPDVKENMTTATVASVNGMGAPAMPGNPGTQGEFSTQETGSGDIPYSLVKGQPTKRKKSSTGNKTKYSVHLLLANVIDIPVIRVGKTPCAHNSLSNFLSNTHFYASYATHELLSEPHLLGLKYFLLCEY